MVAEDEDVIRNGIVKYIILHTDRFTNIYEAQNGQEAIDLMMKHQPDMMLLDVQMPLKTGIEHPLVTMAQEYIREHYTENLSLSQVAEKLGVSNGYLSTLLNQNMGCGFVDYLNQIRIDRACCYLRQSYLKNYEIAYKVGFQDEKYFSKVFKKVIGMTPKEYRMGSK